MAAETTTTSLTNIINSEVIEQTIADYLIDKNVIAPLVTYRSLAGKASKTWTFTRWVKDTAADITEGTAISSNTEMTMAQNSVSVAQVGIAREITEFAKETNTLGPAGLMARAVQDGVALCSEAREDDLAALFISLTGTTIGSTGVDLSVANFIEAIARLRTAKVSGRLVCVLDDQQQLDLMQGVAAATGSVWSNQAGAQQSVLNSRMDGVVGSMLNTDIWYTNLTDTTNTAADVVGGIWVDPAANDEQCALALVELWAPRVFSRPDPYMVSDEMSIVTAYGCGVKYATAGLPIVTDA
jgi:hypothetical protein